MAYFRWRACTELSSSTGIGVHSKSTNQSRIIRHQSRLNEHSPELWPVIFSVHTHCNEEEKLLQRISVS